MTCWQKEDVKDLMRTLKIENYSINLKAHTLCVYSYPDFRKVKHYFYAQKTPAFKKHMWWFMLCYEPE